jgi:tRNA-specific 2-thiouridylase
MSNCQSKVVVAMSGGVDSSVAAALLVEAGYEVISVTMRLGPEELDATTGRKTCCGLSEVEDARRVADKLGIPHYALNFREVFQATVIDDFISEYRRGRTPNPCLRCNQHVKFAALLKRALDWEADFIATGHYARVSYKPERDRWVLRRGVDGRKDQSYALYLLTQDQLARTLLPLGALTKERTREIARDLGLRTADKPESQDICFIPDGDYPRFLRERAPETVQPGRILDRSGRTLGEHSGTAFYTVGQRKRLGLSAPEPLYVVDIDAGQQTLQVDTWAGCYREAVILEAVNYVSVPPLRAARTVQARARYNMELQPAMVEPRGETGARVRFLEPQRALTPGQAVVFYDGDEVLGGGTIREVEER